MELSEVVFRPPLFHAHVFLATGRKMGVWKKIGNLGVDSKSFEELIFRDTYEVENLTAGLSEKWTVWKINGPRKRVGRLEGSLRNAEIGMVINPLAIVHRIVRGEYNFIYPAC